MPVVSVLFLGGTGYIGSQVFNTILNAHPALQYTVLVDSHDHFAHISGVISVKGSLGELVKITKLASQADIVINIAKSNDLGLVNAIIAGLRIRRACGFNMGTFIHTSCTSAIASSGLTGTDLNADGHFNPTGADKSGNPIHSLVDLVAFKAAFEGVAKTHIICPGLVYGESPSRRVSRFYESIINDALKVKAVSIVGGGDGVVDMIHINDLSTIYLLVLNSALFHLVSTMVDPRTTPIARLYIASAFKRDLKSIVSFFAQSLYSKGLILSSNVAISGPILAESKSTAHRSCEEKAQTGYAPSTEACCEIIQVRQEFGWKPEEQEWEHFAEWDIERALKILEKAFAIPRTG